MTGLFAAVLLAAAPVAPGDIGPVSHPAEVPAFTPVLDSARVHRDARRAQEEFERFRERQIPAQPPREGGGGCAEPLGRLCLNFAPAGSGPPAPPPPEPRAVAEARYELLDALAEAARELPGDDWIAGQRVRYLVEVGDLLGAGAAVDQCRGTPWWCRALDGLVLHEEGNYVDAGEAFLEVLDDLSPREREQWAGESYLLERDGRRFLDVSDPAERERRRALLWRLSDPLYMVPGNDRWTAHMARWTLVRTMEDTWNPFGLSWDIDLEELTMRYGWSVGWQRVQGPRSFQQLSENRMVGRLDMDRRRYLPLGQDLEAFPQTEDDALRVLVGREPEGYSPSYAPVVENLTSQTARFRRGDDLFVVHAFARDPASVASEDVAARMGLEGGGTELAGRELPRDLRTALFLLPLDGPIVEDDPRPVREGIGSAGATLADVWTVLLPNDVDRILSFEGYSRLERRAWRTRRGLARLPDPDGPVAVSDPIFLDAGPDEIPETLDAALGHVVPTVRFAPGTQVRIGWEVYGLPEGSQARVALGIERAERSFVRALGEFFRVLDPPAPVVIRWDDAPPEEPGTVFRAVDLQLPALDPGRYDLYLEILSDDHPPAVTRRRFVVEDGG